MKKNAEKKMYWIWGAMRQRCLNPKNIYYKNYGERGIDICETWNTFDIFIKDMGIPPENWTLDRADNDKGYCVKNCIWSLRIAQTRNRRNTKIYEIQGKQVTLKEYAKSKSLNYRTLKNRIQKGMSIENAIYEGKYPNNNIYGKDENGRFIKKDRLCAIEEKYR